MCEAEDRKEDFIDPAISPDKRVFDLNEECFVSVLDSLAPFEYVPRVSEEFSQNCLSLDNAIEKAFSESSSWSDYHILRVQFISSAINKLPVQGQSLLKKNLSNYLGYVVAFCTSFGELSFLHKQISWSVMTKQIFTNLESENMRLLDSLDNPSIRKMEFSFIYQIMYLHSTLFWNDVVRELENRYTS